MNAIPIREASAIDRLWQDDPRNDALEISLLLMCVCGFQGDRASDFTVPFPRVSTRAGPAVTPIHGAAARNHCLKSRP